jgi:hypothetical protein
MNARSALPPATGVSRHIMSVGLRFWDPVELLDLKTGSKRVFPNFRYTGRLTSSLTKTLWILVGEDGCFGRPLAGWKKPITDGSVSLYVDGMELLNVHDLKEQM